MMSRRDALKRAATVTAATPLAPFAVTPERAAALLSEPAEMLLDRARPHIAAADELDPIAFADGIDGTDWLWLFESGAAVEMAQYKQAFNRALDQFGITGPELSGRGHALNDLDEAALAMWCMAWMAGIRAGAAYEHLRLALVSPRQSCDACQGNGRLWGGRPSRQGNDGTNEAVCTTCSGLGHVATPPATLDLGGTGA